MYIILMFMSGSRYSTLRLIIYKNSPWREGLVGFVWDRRVLGMINIGVFLWLLHFWLMSYAHDDIG